MSSRTARTMIAYPQPDQPVELRTRGSYSHAGLVFQQDGSWEMAAHGTSPRSVERRAKASAGRQYAGRAQALVNSMVCVTPLWEATAPAVAEYFGHHRVTVIAVFRPEHGWQSVSWAAGRPALRRLAAEGYAGVMIEGRRDGERHARHADFTMTEIVRSLNSRRASV
jgi:hypothetical protein